MYTRCPDCNTVHALSAADLVQAGGIVTCGDCRKVYNALTSLFDQRPESGEAPAAGREASGMPPVLRPVLELEAPPAPVMAPFAPQAAQPGAAVTEVPDLPIRQVARWPAAAWSLAAIGFLAALGWQAYPLLRPPPEASAAPGAPQAWRIVSQDRHPHPARQDAAIISLELLNDSPDPSLPPQLEMRWFDMTENPVALRRFAPAEYLAADRDPLLPAGGGERLRVLLQLRVPDNAAGGYEFKLY